MDGSRQKGPTGMAHNEDVKLHFLDYWRVIRIRWILVLLAFLLVLITAAIFTYFQPREYQSFVFVEVKSTAENPRIFAQGDMNQPIHDPQLAPTVYQVIQRTGILYPVIEQLAPDGFDNIENVLSYSQREAIVRGYASKAGFAATGPALAAVRG